MLDWLESPGFLTELNGMLASSGAEVSADDEWGPRGWEDPVEPRLETFGPRALPGVIDWSRLTRWWLEHPSGANTPNWDMAATCTVAGRKGLVLLEAKAHSMELGLSGKSLRSDASEKSRENDRKIRAAIAEASGALSEVVSGVTIRSSWTYQLANRIAHAWWLAREGVPTVLLYLAFLNDPNMYDQGEPITDLANWRACFANYARRSLPEGFSERWIPCGKAEMYLALAVLDMPRGYPSGSSETPSG